MNPNSATSPRRNLGIHCRAFLALAGAALAACAAPIDLSAVQKYASTTASAGTSFASLAADFKASCIRTNGAESGLISGTSSQKSPTLIALPTTDQLRHFVTVVPSIDPGYVFSPQPTQSSGSPVSSPKPLPSQSTCDDAGQVSIAWDNANTTVLNYVQSLGNLAGVDSIPTPNASPLVSPLEKVGVSSAALGAVSGLLSSVSAFYQQQAAQREIRTFLAQVNPSMPGAIEALEVTDAAYSTELYDEFNAIALVYPGPVRAELAQYDALMKNGAALCKNSKSQDPTCTAVINKKRMAIARDLLRKKAAVDGALGFVNAQRDASAAYGAAIGQILTTHEELYAASQRSATLQDYVNIIQTTGAPVLTDLSNLAKAVK